MELNKETKKKIREFPKQYFVYQETDPQIPEPVKQELTKLGATKPYYEDSEAERSIQFREMLDSEENWIKQTVLKEIQQYFLAKDTAETLTLLSEIKNYQNNLDTKMRKMKETRERQKSE